MKSHAMQFARSTVLPILLLAFVANGARATVDGGATTTRDASQQIAKPISASDLSGNTLVTPEVEADLLVIHHKYLNAIAVYKQITPQTARIEDKIGVAYEHMFMDQDAKAYFDRALKTDRKFAQAYNNLGTIAYHEKNYKRAERFYKRAIRLDANNASVYGNLGTLYVARKQFRNAAESYQRAYMINPGIFQEIAENGIEESSSVEDLQAMNYCFAQIFAQAGRNDLAVLYLEKAISEGFHDKAKLHQDTQFAGLRGTPEFERLLSSQSK